MSRRKKGKQRRPEVQSEPERTGPAPDPPRPSLPLLLFAIILTLFWIGGLLALALLT
jgi:hypothetical protein